VYLFFVFLTFGNAIISMMMIMIEMQCSSTAFLLLVNSIIPHQNNGTARPSYISYCLTLHCQLCWTSYTAVCIDNCLKITSAIKVATMKISITNGSHHVHTTKLTLLRWAKIFFLSNFLKAFESLYQYCPIII